MGHDVQAVHRSNTRALAIGQAQAATDGLLDQRARVGRSQGHDGVEVRHVPALFEHVDVDDDLSGFVHALHRQELGDHLLLFGPRAAGVHLDHLVRVAPFVEGR